MKTAADGDAARYTQSLDLIQKVVSQNLRWAEQLLSSGNVNDTQK